MKILVVGVALLIAAGAPRPADACSCSGPRAAVYPKDALPTNAHVFVWVSDSMFSEHMSPFALRADDKKRIELDETSVVTGDIRVVEAVPRAALSPKTTYEVVDAANKVIGKITTGDGPRTEKMEWKGIASAEQGKFSKSGGGSCRMGNPFIRMTLAQATTPDSTELYAVWVAGKDGKIDYKLPPSTYATGHGAQHVILGRISMCAKNNFTIPKAKTLKLGIKVVGETGATSTPSEVTIDLSKTIDIDQG